MKRYAAADRGYSPQNLILNPIGFTNYNKGTEWGGLPDPKPLALLEHIIKASSNAGDFVLDPFCGCATACVAADRLDRSWVGIDLSPKAIELVNQRLQQSPPLGIGSLFHHGYVTARTDIPRRTDIDAPIPYRQNKHVLFGQQEGICNGCKTEFPSASLRSITASLGLAVALTTWTTCNCFVPAATGSRGTDPRNTCWLVWRSTHE